MAEMLMPYHWRPYHYQMPLWSFLEDGGLRACAVHHRKAGKDLLVINYCATQMFKRVGLYWHIFPTYAQGKKAVWDGLTRDGRSFLSHFPEQHVVSRNNTEMKIEYDNGSIYQIVGCDNPDALRGPNPVFAAFSEYAQDPNCEEAWGIVRPVLPTNKGQAVFIFTPVEPHGEKIFKLAQTEEGWFAEKLSVEDTFKAPAFEVAGWTREEIAAKYERVVSDKDLDLERRGGMSEQEIRREFYCSFASPQAGAWYAPELMLMDQGEKPRITRVPYQRQVPVDLAWDLGWDDDMFLLFIQICGQEIHFIDCIEQNHVDFPEIVRLVKAKPYEVYGKHYFPHDVEGTELGPGKSRLEQLIVLGLLRFSDAVVVPNHKAVEGVNVVRSLFSRFWIDAVKCGPLINSLRNYRQRYDKKNEVYKPKHDSSSHACDALRTFAVGFLDPVLHQRGTHQGALQMEAPEESLLS